MTANKYCCSQTDLYACLLLGWKNYQNNLSALAALCPIFTVEYCLAAVQEVYAAMLLPDDRARSSKSVLLRIDLVALGKECTQKWKMLKIYIANTFEAKKRKIFWKSAGWDYYDAAANENWTSVNNLMISGSNFIQEYRAQLASVIPQDFEAQFNVLKDRFAALYLDFLNSDFNSNVETEAKLLANNACYEKLMAMFRIGQEVFERDEAMRKQFYFSELLSKVTKVGSAGVGGRVLNALNGRPLAEASITLEGSDVGTFTDVEGRFYILRMATGEHNLVVAREGFEPQTLVAQVSVGILTHLGEIHMVPLPIDGATPGGT